jgi:hypothetical protein
MKVNQDGKEIQEWTYGSHSYCEPEEIQMIVFLMLEHLGLEAVKTNATKSCQFEIELRSTK